MNAIDDQAASVKIAVILACFNRRQKTVACLDALMAQTARGQVALDVFITDDASRDGTAAALRSKYADIRLLRGSGALFWNGGMRLAWAEALHGDYDFFLWLNDDTFLYPDTLMRMLTTHATARQSGARAGIVVGSTRDKQGVTSYGGERQHRFRRLTLKTIEPLDVAQSCDTFNGNCVLIARQVADVLGNLDAGFMHAMGDTDYGLRAKRAGIPMWVMPGYAGECVNDGAVAGSYNDRFLPLVLRFRKVLGPKGLPWRSWRLLCQRHGGWLWPIYWSWPYMKVIATTRYFSASRRIS